MGRPDSTERDGPTISPLLAQRVAWIPALVTSLDRATGKVSPGYQVEADPTHKLRVYVGVPLTEPLEEGSDQIVKRLVRHWAALNDVLVIDIRVRPAGIEMALQLKYLGGGECDRTPWDVRGKIKGKSGLGSLQTKRKLNRRRRAKR